MTNTKENPAAMQQKNIEKAKNSTNPLESIPDVSHYGEFILYSRPKEKMDTKVVKWAFKLAERNVGPFYKQLSIGWQPKVKQNDLNKSWARYLVAQDKSGQPVAYAMYRFDLDYGHSVLYCYELQIEPESQRKGLGKFMMDVLERCGRYWQMQKVVLTVLKNNTNAQSFFKAIGYVLDESSPDILEKAEYEILSKQLD